MTEAEAVGLHRLVVPTIVIMIVCNQTCYYVIKLDLVVML